MPRPAPGRPRAGQLAPRAGPLPHRLQWRPVFEFLGIAELLRLECTCPGLARQLAEEGGSSVWRTLCARAGVNVQYAECDPRRLKAACRVAAAFHGEPWTVHCPEELRRLIERGTPVAGHVQGGCRGVRLSFRLTEDEASQLWLLLSRIQQEPREVMATEFCVETPIQLQLAPPRVHCDPPRRRLPARPRPPPEGSPVRAEGTASLGILWEDVALSAAACVWLDPESLRPSRAPASVGSRLKATSDQQFSLVPVDHECDSGGVAIETGDGASGTWHCCEVDGLRAVPPGFLRLLDSLVAGEQVRCLLVHVAAGCTVASGRCELCRSVAL